VECSDSKCGRILWDFDTGNTQGWATTSDSPLEAVTATPMKKFSGTHALAGRAISDEYYQVYIETKICNGMATDLVGRRFKAQILMDMTPHAGSNPGAYPKPYICLSWKDSSGKYTSDACKIPDKSGWYAYETFNTNVVADLTAVRLEVMLSGGGWDGTMYIDDMQLVEE
jgi:hypothetical protein